MQPYSLIFIGTLNHIPTLLHLAYIRPFLLPYSGNVLPVLTLSVLPTVFFGLLFLYGKNHLFKHLR
jgi:hypothetical protein